MRFSFRALGLALGLLTAAPAFAQRDDEIVIGATCAVTGQLAATGLTVLHALEMAVEDVNAAGGVNGKKLRLVNEDAGSSNSSAVTAYIKLVQQHKIPFAFISSYSPQIIAQSTEIQRVGIGAMHAGGATDIESLNNPYLFRIKPPDQVNTKAVASVVLDDLKKSRPGVIYVQNDYGQGFAKGLEEIFAARGITLIKESYGPGDNDMSAQLQSLVNQGVDVLLTAGFNRDSALVLRARKAMGITLPVVGQQALGVSATTDLMEADELEGIYALVDAVLDERKQYDKTDFMRRYQERHNLKPDPSFITNYYDGVWMVADAIKAVGEDPKKVRDYIAGLKGYNALTRAYTTDEKGNMTNDVVIVRYAKDKVQIPIRTFSATPAGKALSVAGRPAIDVKEIVIGATVPITGSSATSGLLYYNGLKLAEEDINAAGGINGVPVKFVFEDAQASNSSAVSAFVKVVQEQKPVAMFISSFTPQNFATEPEVKRAGVPTFYAGGADGLHKIGNPWMFRIKQPDSVGAAAMVDVVLKDLKTTKPAILFAQNDYGQGMATEMTRLFRAAGIEPIVESYPLDENDFGTHLLSVADKGADTLMAVSYVRDMGLLLNARRSLGLKMPIVANTTLPLPSTMPLLSAEDIDGAYAVTDAYLPGRKDFDTMNFLERYQQRFGVPADASFVTNYYDAAQILADGLRNVGTDPGALRNHIATLKDRPGITRNYTTDAFGNLGSSVDIVKFTPGTKDFTFVRHFQVGGETTTVQAVTPTAVPQDRPSRWKAAAQTIFNGIAIGCIYALLALGFVLVYEATGVVNFANGQFVVIGAFLGISGIAALGATVPGTVLALVAMVCLGILFFFVVYRPLQQSPVVTVIVGTIAVGIIVQNIGLLIWGPLPQRLPSPFGLAPVSVLGVVISAHIIAIILITALVVGALYLLLYKTVIGARMRAVAQDAEAAKLMGINVAGIYALTWALAGGLAGLGGLLMGPVWFVDASMGDAMALKSFAATIIGGFGSVPGAVLGGLIVGLAESLGAAYISSTYKDALVFLLMVGFLIARPQGLFGEARGDRG
jgi:branched-chain amino acid transport system permease protein